jgi:hypothetical protein
MQNSKWLVWTQEESAGFKSERKLLQGRSGAPIKVADNRYQVIPLK